MSIRQVDLQPDVEAVNNLSVVPGILDVVCKLTGMGFAAVARVTEERWVACRVLDKIAFGLEPGGELVVETTICHEVRQHSSEVVIDHVAEDPLYCKHHTPAMYGFQSYISMPIFRKDGSFFGTLCAIDPNPAEVSRPEIVVTFRLFADLISCHLEAQELLQLSEARLQEEKQIAEMREQLIAIIGHDLRSPLAACYSGSDLLLRLPLEKKAAELVTIVRDSSNRALGLIDSMLDFARGRLGNGLNVKIERNANLAKGLFQVITELLTTHPNRNIQADIVLKEAVYCDEDRITQLFSNLLLNAILHGADDTPIFVKARCNTGEFELSVSNAGEQIPEGVQEHLFKPFSGKGGKKRKKGAKGLGLGLFIGAEIAKAHQGELEVSSTEEQTRFKLRMPAASLSSRTAQSGLKA